jgi:rSAM/selenodomain-associated transferase 2
MLSNTGGRNTVSGMVSVIVPVCHESGLVVPAVERLLDMSPRGCFEIIVVDGVPEGDTLRALGNRGIIGIRSVTGRAVQMNAGARAASGDVLIFLHVDTSLPDDAFRLIRSALADSRYVGGAFDLTVKSDKAVYALISRVASWRSRLTRIPFGDQAIFIRKEYFQVIGGFRPLPIMEDVDLMRRIKHRGDAICILPARAETSPRRWEREGILFCTARNWLLQVLYMCGVSPHILVRLYLRESETGRTRTGRRAV